jgi:hypothetical protein
MIKHIIKLNINNIDEIKIKNFNIKFKYFKIKILRKRLLKTLWK